ncbi:hypothetical protein [Ruminiclostridium josui]|uniref:hypothetical protein n=1 Tax=Ruminiclostridium josui TaxID=1499 RepID=UPI000467825D|nr:hypothetical protein [Ruminiclostridium josui]
MQNRKQQDSIAVNNISQENKIKREANKDTGNAGKDPFCVYDHKRHAVGSKITSENGLQSVCTEEGSWKVKK